MARNSGLCKFAPKVRNFPEYNHGPGRSQNLVAWGGVYCTPPPARYPPRVAGLRPLPLPAHASISSLHFGCISGNPYLCSFAVSSLHWALGYHGGDLVLTSHLLQHLCMFLFDYVFHTLLLKISSSKMSFGILKQLIYK